MDKANNPPSDGDENVSYFDCERDCEMEFVASKAQKPKSKGFLVYDEKRTWN